MEATLSHNVAIRECDHSVAQFPQVMQSETEQFLLLREMHHRLANSFSILVGMFRREFCSFPLAAVRGSIDRFEGRIVAFGNLHRFLTIGADTGWISAKPYIEQLCQALAEALLNPLGVRCEVSADAQRIE